MEKASLLFFGAPLLDIMAPCGPEALASHGLVLDDCVLATDDHEGLISEVFGRPDSRLSAGGSSQNTARVAKWAAGDRLHVAFTGCVGQDEFAVQMSKCLVSEGVEPIYVPLAGRSTGVCVCLLDPEGQRSMCTRLGAAALYAEDHLREPLVRGKLARAHSVFVEGYFLGHSPGVVRALAEACAPNQVFAVSLSAEYVCREHGPELLAVLPRVDVLFSNRAEARAIAGALGLRSDASVEETSCKLATYGSRPRIVVVTQGPDPVIVVQGPEKPRRFPVPGGIKVLDSVGCGDALAGAFLAVHALTGDVQKGVETGIRAAAEVTQVTGCNPTGKRLFGQDGDSGEH